MKIKWFFCLIVLAGCQAHQMPQTRMDKILAAHPFGPQESFQMIDLNRTSTHSVHAVRIRTQEKPHRHVTHDATFMVRKGEGTLYLNGQGINLYPGDVVTIPMNTPHYYVNRVTENPTEGVAIYAPPFDGVDRVLEPGQ